eukprot:1145192-Pelagomonas_calceolata.AAC.3
MSHKSLGSSRMTIKQKPVVGSYGKGAAWPRLHRPACLSSVAHKFWYGSSLIAPAQASVCQQCKTILGGYGQPALLHGQQHGQHQPTKLSDGTVIANTHTLQDKHSVAGSCFLGLKNRPQPHLGPVHLTAQAGPAVQDLLEEVQHFVGERKASWPMSNVSNGRGRTATGVRVYVLCPTVQATSGPAFDNCSYANGTGSVRARPPLKKRVLRSCSSSRARPVILLVDLQFFCGNCDEGIDAMCPCWADTSRICMLA